LRGFIFILKAGQGTAWRGRARKGVAREFSCSLKNRSYNKIKTEKYLN